MEKKIQCFIGVDVSKCWFDVSIMFVVDHVKQSAISFRLDNNHSGIKKLHQTLKSKKVPFSSDSLLVMENTGIYHRQIWAYCSTHRLPCHIGNAANIKWSFGIARGKNDQIDSLRICNYAYTHFDALKATPNMDPKLTGLNDLMTARDKLVSQISTINMFLGELKNFNSKEDQQLLENIHKPTLKGLKQSLDLVDETIRKRIRDNNSFETNYQLLLSVPGIGPVTAGYLISCTNNFINKPTGKQLACYAGVAPFSCQSGSSIKGRDKVHKMANKDLKKLLHMSAITAITHYPEFTQYYERKQKEGKHKMSIINAVRSKIALRVAAAINNRAPYTVTCNFTNGTSQSHRNECQQLGDDTLEKLYPLAAAIN